MGGKGKNSNKNCSINSSETTRKIRAPHTDVQIETGCLTPDTVGLVAENWGRNSASKEIWDEEGCASGPPIMTNPLQWCTNVEQSSDKIGDKPEVHCNAKIDHAPPGRDRNVINLLLAQLDSFSIA